jgi:hypothetical protein
MSLTDDLNQRIRNGMGLANDNERSRIAKGKRCALEHDWK